MTIDEEILLLEDLAERLKEHYGEDSLPYKSAMSALEKLKWE